MAIKHYIDLPDGETATRQSNTRRYTHAVVMFTDDTLVKALRAEIAELEATITDADRAEYAANEREVARRTPSHKAYRDKVWDFRDRVRKAFPLCWGAPRNDPQRMHNERVWDMVKRETDALVDSSCEWAYAPYTANVASAIGRVKELRQKLEWQLGRLGWGVVSWHQGPANGAKGLVAAQKHALPCDHLELWEVTRAIETKPRTKRSA